MSSVIHVSQVYYPESDGKPMGETDDHRQEIVRHIEILEDYYRGQKVYVSGNLLVYYVQGEPRTYVAPDAFVVKGIPPKNRRTYKIWVEGKAPDVVIETTSRKTRRKDMSVKPQRYARLGVKEYFLFDPLGEYLDPPLQGYRLAGEEGIQGAAAQPRCSATSGSWMLGSPSWPPSRRTVRGNRRTGRRKPPVIGGRVIGVAPGSFPRAFL